MSSGKTVEEEELWGDIEDREKQQNKSVSNIMKM